MQEDLKKVSPDNSGSRDSKIKIIQEVISDKTLSMGCKVTGEWRGELGEMILYNAIKVDSGYRQSDKNRNIVPQRSWVQKPYKMNIIGHPVMIGDVLDFVEEIENNDCNNNIHHSYCNQCKDIVLLSYNKKVQYLFCSQCNSDGAFDTLEGKLLIEWKEKRKPIDEQSVECIDYVYSLLPLLSE